MSLVGQGYFLEAQVQVDQKINVLSGSFKAPQLLYVIIAELRFSSPSKAKKKMASQTCKEIEPFTKSL